MRRSNKNGARGNRTAPNRAVQCRDQAAILAPVTFTPATSLILPAIHQDVPVLPRTVTSSNPIPIAEALAEAGILQPRHWHGDPTEAIDFALTDLNKVKKMNVGIGITDNLETEVAEGYSFGGEADAFREELKISDNKKLGYMCIYSNDTLWYIVGKTLDQLEREKRGLGYTIYVELLRSMYGNVGCISPHAYYSFCSHQYWQGEDDETQALEEMVLSEDPKLSNDKDALKKAMDEYKDWYRLKDFQNQFPEWSYKHNRTKIDLTKVRSRDSKHPKLQQIISATLALKAQASHWNKEWRNHAHLMRETYTTDLAAPLFLRWHEDDDALRFIDYEHECNCNNGDTVQDLCYMTVFPSDDVKVAAAMFRRYQVIFNIMRAAEQLVSLIGVREDRSRT